MQSVRVKRPHISGDSPLVTVPPQLPARQVPGGKSPFPGPPQSFVLLHHEIRPSGAGEGLFPFPIVAILCAGRPSWMWGGHLGSPFLSPKF